MRAKRENEYTEENIILRGSLGTTKETGTSLPSRSRATQLLRQFRHGQDPHVPHNFLGDRNVAGDRSPGGQFRVSKCVRLRLVRI
jgi:hypothetical protein